MALRHSRLDAEIEGSSRTDEIPARSRKRTVDAFLSCAVIIIVVSICRVWASSDVEVSSSHGSAGVHKIKKKGTDSKEIFAKTGSSSDIEIEMISLLGERNTGTNWIFDELEQCFGGELEVKKGFTRYKHWFQDSNVVDSRETMVIAMFRNPYHWLHAMRLKPHHCPNHLFLDWRTFATKTWTTPRLGLDLEIDNPDDAECQQHFHYNDIVSCHRYPEGKKAKNNTRRLWWSENQPFYEMRNDGSGLPYSNLLELRKDKILNFLNVSTYDHVRAFKIVQYEYLLQYGTKALIRMVEKATGKVADCKPSEPQRRNQPPTSKSYILWMNRHVDWEAESLIGYKKQNI